MALISCPECGKEVSEFANSCPNCGLPKEMFAKVKSGDDLRQQIMQYIEDRENGIATWEDLVQGGLTRQKEFTRLLFKDEQLNGEFSYPKATSDFCARRANEILEAEKEFIRSIDSTEVQSDIEKWFKSMETLMSNELRKTDNSNKMINKRILRKFEAFKFVKYIIFALSEADDVLYEWECVSNGKKVVSRFEDIKQSDERPYMGDFKEKPYNASWLYGDDWWNDAFKIICDNRLVIESYPPTGFLDPKGHTGKAVYALARNTNYIDAYNKACEEKRQTSEKISRVLESFEAINTNPIKCPNCGSSSVSKLSTIGRAASVGLFGLASSKIGKTYKCSKCGYKW